MKLKDVALAVKELQTWKVQVDQAISTLQEQSAEFGRRLDHLQGVATSEPAPRITGPATAGPATEPLTTAHAPFGYGFSSASKDEPAAPILTASGEAEVAGVALTTKHALAEHEAAKLSEELIIGVSDVRTVEAAVIACLAKELRSPIEQLQKLSRHPDVDRITQHALTVFVNKAQAMLGLGDAA